MSLHDDLDPPPGLNFGGLLEWLLNRGVRAPGHGRPGNKWGFKEFAEACLVSEKTVNNWRRNASTPRDTDTIERVLFGIDAQKHYKCRIRLREAVTFFVRAETERYERKAVVGSVAAVDAAKPRFSSNIPIAVPRHFLGRDDAIDAIDSALRDSGGRAAITALYGMRGIGKTTLAAAYAERRRSDYRAVWWVRAQTPGTMRADLAALGIRLGWVLPEEKEASAFEKVAERLHRCGEGLLLIYDNAIDADALRPFLPKGGAARLLITSNAHAWRGLAEPIEIKLWPKQVGADYFVARLGREGERVQAEDLSEALSGLPLAHEQAAAYCERLGVSLKDYMRRFKEQPAKLLDAAKYASAEYHEGLTVAKTFALAIEEARNLHPASESLIIQASLLAPEPIPLFLLEEGTEELGLPLVSGLAEEGLDEALAALRTYALVDLDSVRDEQDPTIETRCFRLHRLVRTLGMARCEGEAREVARSRLVGAIERSMDASGDAWDSASWPRLRRLAGLANELIGPSPINIETDVRVAAISDRLATFYQCALGDYTRAQPLLERALAIHEKAFGPEHPETATIINNFAMLLHDRGDLEGAQPRFERALAIREQTLGQDHPHTALSLNNLASVLKDRGDLAEAQPLCERALAIYERTLGPEHPSTALSLNTLARLLKDRGDLPGAQPLYERALAIYERTLGPEHLSTAISLNNLGRLLQDRGDLVGARPLCERSLAIFEKALGADHPDTATLLNNLATLFLAEGNFAAARPLLQRALYIDEKAFGEGHLNTARKAGNLAVVLTRLEDFTAAEPLLCRAIAICESVLGTDNPLTQRYQVSYAALLTQTGRAAEGLPRAEKALEVQAKVNGPNHLWTRDTARAIAEALESLHCSDEARTVRDQYSV